MGVWVIEHVCERQRTTFEREFSPSTAVPSSQTQVTQLDGRDHFPLSYLATPIASLLIELTMHV